MKNKPLLIGVLAIAVVAVLFKCVEPKLKV